jgi:nitrate/nitrite transporter NarK
VATPMADAYGVSLALIGLLATSSIATHAAMQIPSGRLVDRLGGRTVALAGVSILIAADCVGALTPQLTLAVMARMLIGVGTAFCFVAGSDLLRARSAPALAQGLYGGVAMSGAGLALALLPAVPLDTRWRASWLSAALLAGISLVSVLPISRRRAATAPRAFGPSSSRSVVRDRRLIGLAALYTASYGSSVVLGNWVVTFLERTAGYSTASAGAAGALTLFAGILSRPLGGWLAERRPLFTRRAAAAGLVATAGGALALAFSPELIFGVLASMAIGIGAGIPFGAVFSGAQHLRPDRPAAAVGFVNSVANVAVVVGVPLVGLSFSLPGDGRLGLMVVGGLSAAALAVLPPAAVLSPGPSAATAPVR